MRNRLYPCFATSHRSKGGSGSSKRHLLRQGMVLLPLVQLLRLLQLLAQQVLLAII
jgi:hypothetical protein